MVDDRPSAQPSTDGDDHVRRNGDLSNYPAPHAHQRGPVRRSPRTRRYPSLWITVQNHVPGQHDPKPQAPSPHVLALDPSGGCSVISPCTDQRALGSPLCHPCRSGAVSTGWAGTVVTGLVRFPARCGHTPVRGRGQDSTGRSTRVAGLVLTPIPCGAESVRREPTMWLGVGPCLQRPLWTVRRTGVRLPVIPSPRRGAAWSDTAAARWDQSSSTTTPPAVGVRHRAISRLAAPGLVLTPLGSGNGCARRAARRRPA
jgi:hypothetical protein